MQKLYFKKNPRKAVPLGNYPPPRPTITTTITTYPNKRLKPPYPSMAPPTLDSKTSGPFTGAANK